MGNVTSRVLVIVFLCVFLDLIGFGIILPILPFYVQTTGGSAQTLGLLLASFSITQFVFTPLLGRLSDSIGRRPVIVASLAGQALSMLVFAAATRLQSLPMLFAARIAAGATAGNIAACQAAIADVTTGPARAKGMGRVGAGIGLGFVIGPLIGASLSTAGPSAPAFGAAALSTIGLVIAAALMPETHKVLAVNLADAVSSAPASGSRRGAAWIVLKDRAVLTVLAIYFLSFVGATTLQVGAGLLGQSRFGWGPKEVGRALGLFGIIMVLVQGALIGRVTQVLGERNAMHAGTLAMAAGFSGFAVSYSTAAVIASLVLVAAGMGIVTSLAPSMASQLAGQQAQGAVLGVLQSLGGLARAVGPVAAGVLYAHASPGAPFVCVSALAFVSLIFSVGHKTTTVNFEADRS